MTVQGLCLVLSSDIVEKSTEYHRVTRAARAALEAAAQVVLSEAQWRHVDDVLAAFVPDFGREQSEAERGELIKAVVQALTIFHGRAAGMVQAWQGAHPTFAWWRVGACSGTGVGGCRGMPRARLERRRTITNGALSGRARSRQRRVCSCPRSTAVGR